MKQKKDLRHNQQLALEKTKILTGEQGNWLKGQVFLFEFLYEVGFFGGDGKLCDLLKFTYVA